MYPGIDYNNYRVVDVTNVTDIDKESVPRTVQRMPWQDIALHFRGPSVADLVRHFIDYWNHVNFEKNYEEGNMLTLANRNSAQKFQKMEYQNEEDRMKGLGVDFIAASFNREVSLSKKEREAIEQQATSL